MKRLEGDTNNKICLYYENFISFMCFGGVKKAKNLFHNIDSWSVIGETSMIFNLFSTTENALIDLLYHFGILIFFSF